MFKGKSSTSTPRHRSLFPLKNDASTVNRVPRSPVGRHFRFAFNDRDFAPPSIPILRASLANTYEHRGDAVVRPVPRYLQIDHLLFLLGLASMFTTCAQSETILPGSHPESHLPRGVMNDIESSFPSTILLVHS
jgi:hypothetical protein